MARILALVQNAVRVSRVILPSSTIPFCNEIDRHDFVRGSCRKMRVCCRKMSVLQMEDLLLEMSVLRMSACAAER